ncbi:hypothetical protein [Azospirillum sp.]|uniref:hypothetical protein n=1 Tax=Azospirillum sp. TaxID=34012 RepID=UPI002D4A9C18|nr:hypothetical protein [Azospirillum sp.]HYD70139.1 hypothetical protein [Azospirillum sp.]
MTDARSFSADKYWLKRARVPVQAVDGAAGLTADPDGTALADVRIEEGRIRAVLPAGEAPCCARGVDLAGGAVRPLAANRLAPGEPADLIVDCGPGGRVVLRGGAPDDSGCSLGIACVCTPPGR